MGETVTVASFLQSIPQIEFLADPYKIKLLLYGSANSFNAQNASMLLDIPIAVTYRKIHELEGLGILTQTDRVLTDQGKRVSLYSATLERAELRLHDHELSACVKIKDDENRLCARAIPINRSNRNSTVQELSHVPAERDLSDAGLEELVGVMLDHYNLSILASLPTGDSASAGDISSQLKIPIAVAFRRINDLEQSGLIRVSEKPLTCGGKREHMYSNNLTEFDMQFSDGSLAVFVQYVNGGRISEVKKRYQLSLPSGKLKRVEFFKPGGYTSAGLALPDSDYLPAPADRNAPARSPSRLPGLRDALSIIHGERTPQRPAAAPPIPEFKAPAEPKEPYEARPLAATTHIETLAAEPPQPIYTPHTTSVKEPVCSAPSMTQSGQFSPWSAIDAYRYLNRLEAALKG